MPSGASCSPSAAHTRRSVSEPSDASVQAVSRSACDSATTRVVSSMITMPLGNQTSPATCCQDPSGRTTPTRPGLGSSQGMEPGMSTQQLPRRSTTISLKGCPAAPYGAGGVPANTPPGLPTTSRPSDNQSIEDGNPSTRASTRRPPEDEKDSTSPANQSHIQNRP